MNTIVEQTETTEISFGDKLRQTREALNLSLDDSDILDSDTRAFLDDCMYKLKFIIDDLS